MFPTAKVSRPASVASVPGSSSAIFAQDLFSTVFLLCTLKTPLFPSSERGNLYPKSLKTRINSASNVIRESGT
jgi:hypothetical protein